MGSLSLCFDPWMLTQASACLFALWTLGIMATYVVMNRVILILCCIVTNISALLIPGFSLCLVSDISAKQL